MSSFISLTVAAGFQRRQIWPNVCNVTRRCGKIAVTRWRCSMHEPENSGEKVEESQQSDGENRGKSEFKGEEGVVFEGSMELEAPDQHFEDVLSKDWNELMNFDLENISVEPKPDYEGHAQQSKDASGRNLVDDSEVLSSDTGSIDKKPKSKSKKQTRKKNPTLSTNEDHRQEDFKVKGTKKQTSPANNEKEKRIAGAAEKDEVDEGWSDVPHWYFVQVKPGCERHVAQSIRNLAISLETDEILDVFVPTTTVVRLTKGGESIKRDERYFPGYIMVLMVMNRETYGSLLRVTHVQCFMGDANRGNDKKEVLRAPTPIKDSEMRKLFEKLREGEGSKIDKKLVFSPGDSVRVVAGSMEGSKGKVIAVTPDLDIVKASLLVFGRETLVELKTNQLEAHNELEEIVEEQVEEEENALELQRRKANGRNRVDSMLGKVDYAKAGVASAADDLAALLADDADNAWDPLGGELSRQRSPKKSDNRYKAEEDVSGENDDGFASGHVEDDEFESLDKDNDRLTSNSDDNDRFASSYSIDTKSQEVFSWNKDENEIGSSKWPASTQEKKREEWSEEDLDKFLDGGNVDDVWEAKEEIVVEDEKHNKQNRSKTVHEEASSGRSALRKSSVEADANVSNFLKEIEAELDKDEMSSDEEAGQETEKDDPLFKDLGGEDDFLDDEFALWEEEDSERTTIEEVGVGDSMEESKKRRKKKNRMESEKIMDEEYMVALEPKELDIDNLQSIVKVEGEDEMEKVDLRDDAPYEIIHYDEIVANEKKNKARGKTNTSMGRTQPDERKTGRPRGRPRKSKSKSKSNVK